MMVSGSQASHEVRLSLGGVTVNFVAQPDYLRILPARPFIKFVTQVVPEYQVQVYARPLPENKDEVVLFETRGWRYARVGDRKVFHGHVAQVSDTAGSYSFLMDESRPTGELYLENVNRNPEGSLEIPPDPADEILAVQLLAQNRGLLIHSCGINLDGYGLLFAGVSGAGKSTTASLWQGEAGAELLSDERVAIRRQENRFHLYGTSWHGREHRSGTGVVPLKAIYILKHAPTNTARPISTKEAVRELLPRSFLPFWDQVGIAYSLQFLEELCSSVPCFELGFVPDKSVVEYIRSQNV